MPRNREVRTAKGDTGAPTRDSYQPSLDGSARLSAPRGSINASCSSAKAAIGKSTTSTNVSAALAARGERAPRRLHRDHAPRWRCSTASSSSPSSTKSTSSTTHPGRRRHALGPGDRLRRGRRAGGRRTAVAGAGSRDDGDLPRRQIAPEHRYTVSMYDVLGDVVAAASPPRCAGDRREGLHRRLRRGHGAVRGEQHRARRLRLRGQRDRARREHRQPPRQQRRSRPDGALRELINTKILAYVPRIAIREAEYKRQTVMEHAPRSPSPTSSAISPRNLGPYFADCPLPTPLTDLSSTPAPTKFEMSASAAQPSRRKRRRDPEAEGVDVSSPTLAKRRSRPQGRAPTKGSSPPSAPCGWPRQPERRRAAPAQELPERGFDRWPRPIWSPERKPP